MEGHWGLRSVPRLGSIDHTICCSSCKFWHQLSTAAVQVLPVSGRSLGRAGRGDGRRRCGVGLPCQHQLSGDARHLVCQRHSGLVREPDCQAVALAQAGVILTPVHDLVRLLGDMASAVLVQLEKQDGHPGVRGGTNLLHCFWLRHHRQDPCNNAIRASTSSPDTPARPGCSKTTPGKTSRDARTEGDGASSLCSRASPPPGRYCMDWNEAGLPLLIRRLSEAGAVMLDRDSKYRHLLRPTTCDEPACDPSPGNS